MAVLDIVEVNTALEEPNFVAVVVAVVDSEVALEMMHSVVGDSHRKLLDRMDQV